MSIVAPKKSTKAEELQVGSMLKPCMIVSFGSEFDSPNGKSTSARLAVPDEKSMQALRSVDEAARQVATEQLKEYSSFIVGTAKDGQTPIIRAKITRDPRGYTGDEINGAPDVATSLDDGCALLLKVSPFQWTRDDPKYGPKLGVTLYGNVVFCPGRMDNFKLMEAERPLEKRVVKWE
jgi:hypothetical protein